MVHTPEWFPFLLDEFFGDDLEINNTKEDGDHNGSEEETTVEMNSGKEIVAVFSEGEPEKYELTVHVEGKGSMEIDPDRKRYEEGELVNLSAESSEDWEFSHWTAERKDLDSEKEITVKMDSDLEITAHFEESSGEDPSGIFSVPMILGIIFVSLIGAVFVLYRGSDGDIFER